LHDWLVKPYKLTKHLRHACQQHQLKVLQQESSVLSESEIRSLQSDSNEAWVREIIHSLNGEPKVYAKVCVSMETYQAYQYEFVNLAENPIGETLLFHNPEVERAPFSFAKLTTEDHEYSAAVKQLGVQEELWARRSVFYWQDLPLLITEIFSMQMPKFRALELGRDRNATLSNKLIDYAHLTRLH